VYWDQIVYQSNQNHGWWGWVSNNWLGVSDPDLISNLTAASGCHYTTVSGRDHDQLSRILNNFFSFRFNSPTDD
jgi:hypothetical protein